MFSKRNIILINRKLKETTINIITDTTKNRHFRHFPRHHETPKTPRKRPKTRPKKSITFFILFCLIFSEISLFCLIFIISFIRKIENRSFFFLKFLEIENTDFMVVWRLETKGKSFFQRNNDFFLTILTIFSEKK